MSLKNINPTETRSWKLLQQHYNEVKNIHLRDLFDQDKNRVDRFSLNCNELKVDFSKNRVSQKTIDLFIEFAKELRLEESIQDYFCGEKINSTEDRAVLHTALRSNSEAPMLVDGKNIKPKINSALRKIRTFSNKIISGKWKGYTGKKITTVVNIGVGGSDLGPNMVVEGLKFYRNHLETHFLSNVDGDYLYDLLQIINPETTLFIVVSKSFTTQETITNANTIRNWFLKYGSVFDIAKHFVAVSENSNGAQNFGIAKENIFPMWDWVGGRFSVWSSVGLIISLSVGFNNFTKFLRGAEIMDLHFKNEKLENNIPVILGLLSIWYINFFRAETEVIIPYSHYLRKLPAYLQQAFMESNGKSIDRNGNKISYETGSIIWGNEGVNAQHAFMQLLHQGTKLVPADFIGFSDSLHGLQTHHEKLMANYFAQTEALAFGKGKEDVHLELKSSGNQDKIHKLLPFKVFEGNKPSTIFLFNNISPKTLGMLLAMYEHKVFVQGVLWNINSFDQFGVELGKELANKKLKTL